MVGLKEGRWDEKKANSEPGAAEVFERRVSIPYGYNVVA
jgi:hypothetical protein